MTSIVKGLVTTLIAFAIAEAGLRGAYAARNAMVTRVPLPYSVGDDYGPIPPWLDRMLILLPDPNLIWRSAPSVRRTYVDIFSPARTAADRTALLRRFLPTLPAEFRDSPTWTIALNAAGFRSDEFPAEKPASTIRVACVGDSWTFGMNVDQHRTYPSRLAAWLATLEPGVRFEIENFGVLGYSSFQGRQLLERRVLARRPDIVAIGFAMNDSEVAGYRDKDMVGGGPPRAMTRVKDAVTALESYKLMKFAAEALRFRPKPMGAFLAEDAAEKGSGYVDYDAIEPWTRVSPKDFDRNIRAMIADARSQGAAVVLLDNELWEESPYRPVLRAIAADAGVPLVDSVALVGAARQSMVRALEQRLQLAASAAASGGAAAEPTPAPSTRVVFRVSQGEARVATHMSIVGTVAALGDLAPNTIALRDDGQEGDERAGDGVWSVGAAFAPGTRLSYVYTNSGARGQWEGLDVPHIRRVTVPPAPAGGGPVYLPIDTFGRVYMQADDWHTDAVGYDLIARAVSDHVRALVHERDRAAY
jgi:lysophospholipase L1-like esterase